jgi:hypothetical protein
MRSVFMAEEQAKQETSRIKQQPETSFSYLVYCSKLKMKDICSSETFIYLRNTRHYNPQDLAPELPP